jgi:hypothetical protein
MNYADFFLGVAAGMACFIAIGCVAVSLAALITKNVLSNPALMGKIMMQVMRGNQNDKSKSATTNASPTPVLFSNFGPGDERENRVGRV